MITLFSNAKVQATANSMQQFYPVVRSFFLVETDNRTIEAATVFLYMKMSQDMFGKRFCRALGRKLRDALKYGSVDEVRQRVQRIVKRTEAFEDQRAEQQDGDAVETPYERHVRSVIRAILSETDAETDDPTLLKASFTPFEDVVRRMKTHMEGIRDQNRFVMR